MIGFLVLVIFDTLAQVSFKLAANAAAPVALEHAWLLRVVSEPWVYIAVGCYLGTFFTWMTLLVRAPIGPAYAASHLEVVSVLVLSAVAFNEHIGTPQLAGCALIVMGIACLAVGADRSRHAS